MKDSNIKDTITNICGVILAVSGALIAVGQYVPAYVVTYSIIAASISGAIIGYYTGKNPAGTPKTPDQVVEINSKAIAPEPKI